MERYYPVAVVTLLSCLLLFAMALTVARTHAKTGIPAPAMSGHPLLEQASRAHANTLEWFAIFLPSMWLFAIYWSAWWAAGLGLAWIVGRIAYFVGYLKAPASRYPGFLIQTAITLLLLFGSLLRILYLWITQ